MNSRSICVYCGARDGASPTYAAAARDVGTLMAQAGHRLVYGAGDIGLMGQVARAAQAAGGETFGVIPTHLMGAEAGKRDLGTLVVTETMHERKKVMYMNADAILVLPGGAGTLDELFEVLTWRQLGLHSKPIALLDTDGYWQPLLALIEHLRDQGFLDPSFLETFSLHPTPKAALDALTP
ncbi:MAG: TIGR00730 family Rossman fold protein [Pseudomonadota bacterium]